MKFNIEYRKLPIQEEKYYYIIRVCDGIGYDDFKLFFRTLDEVALYIDNFPAYGGSYEIYNQDGDKVEEENIYDPAMWYIPTKSVYLP